MDSNATLQEIFDRLVAERSTDLASALRDAGHEAADLPADLLGHTLVSYCDTAPIEVAEHLEPFVTAVIASTDPDPFDGLELLASVPDIAIDDVIVDVDMDAPPAIDMPADAGANVDMWGDFDFGSGGHDAGFEQTVDHADLDLGFADDHPAGVPDPGVDEVSDVRTHDAWTVDADAFDSHFGDGPADTWGIADADDGDAADADDLPDADGGA